MEEVMQGTADVQDNVVVRSSPPSFDEFEAMHNTEIRDKQLEDQKNHEAKSPNSVKAAADKKTAKKAKKEDPDAKEAKAEADPEAVLGDEDEPLAAKSDEELEKPAKPSKMVKVQSGDETLEIPAEAMIPVKIDGKIEHKPLSELMGGFSGQSSLDRKYSDLKKEQQTFGKQRDALTKGVREFHDLLVNKKDARGAIEYISEMMGADPVKTWKDTFEGLQESYGKISSMTEEERAVWELQEKNAYLEKKMERDTLQKTTQAEVEELQQKATASMEEHGLTQEDLVAADDQLKESSVKDYSLDDLVFLARHNKATTRVEAMLDEVVPELEQRDEAVKALRDELLRGTFTDQDLKEIVTEVYAKDERAERLAKKITKSQRKADKANPSRNPAKDPTFFSDLD